VADELVCPLNEPLHAGRMGVPAVVQPPCELDVQEAVVHWGHFCSSVITFHLKALGAEQGKYSAPRLHRYEAPLVVEPPRLTLLRNTVADEGEARCAEGDELIGIDGNVSPVHAP
jgi:hypothetical protein